MVFNIGSQQGNINNVAGNQTIYGGQSGTFESTGPVQFAVELAEVLRRMGMDRAAADAEAVQRELTQPQPDREGIGARLTRIAQAVTAVAGAESAVHKPLVALARWLGAAGAPILALLGL
ncbi:hypothetical protein [Nocardia crassostreae]|uniref:hypothetical protein n=1 Tax=Nocardia crassostreae TaxID=53428 RepID=UPI000832150B|nr:hypothetical protein [Nocardia crassostreae]